MKFNIKRTAVFNVIMCDFKKPEETNQRSRLASAFRVYGFYVSVLKMAWNNGENI